ncbi:MAG: glycosyltransferase [Candidatus Yonathbacteria bacterium CG_4_10_14_3_um_filter_47_65]|uniref:Glycosyltransferase n=2 Tax=Parcubacteria group TaxID=1794811 RepID=A0A2M8D7R2_9BACT|nr:MAG: hypothetical protein AUJ44_00360 [Candidatus Nomurabacteria bacterium CG1_02_47_685]PIP03893.1 MAG: glycosyltransferase [Candidatus Yonathbacteria bacterium CG23_combo_of_CG06-09_8_20_14_all_46_18]PIQ32828.1 MAG: glycosyltransferase [Candidatus Yonathbacteria bacterium CG17_big_fil_post_rev_8_21_14_2_50_46_19]PIX56098.1 MAG: glycosyltransferase [Candidatus Yonathbacteria bacterium CG_4_10_14_3_um_filter_47_65]PIY57820.1 MAG: glycosyltransferase [Candidatus Yonathbacteria bacterium CG_4_
MSKLLSIVIPAHNEEENIPVIYRAILDVGKNLLGYMFEIIIVNDGSTDDTGKVVEKLADEDPRIKYIEFSRNFSKEIALSAGIHHAHGDAVIMLDADMQHPPELIPLFVKKWKNGADVVIGMRNKRNHEGVLKRFGAALFYALMNGISNVPMDPHATDYRLIDRKVADVFEQFTERNRFTRGLVDWLGFKRSYVSFDASARHAGTASYGTKKLMNLAYSVVFTHTLFPLMIAGYMGAFITITSALLGAFVIVEDVVMGDPLGIEVSGTAMLAIMILFLVGIILVCLGFIASYIKTIQDEVIGRPLYVIARTKNISDDDSARVS